MGQAYSEDDRSRVVESLLETRILPGTNKEGLDFSQERIMER